MERKKKHQHKESQRCSCGKVRFRDREQAIDALHRIYNSAKSSLEEYGTTHRHECQSYQCGLCLGWHLTSRPTKADALEGRLAA